MDELRWLLFRFRSLFRRERREQDLDDELRFHLETEAAERMQAGLAPDHARLAAARSLGNATFMREETRMVWTWTWAEQLARDVRYGWRQLHKSKITSAAAILSLALALGASTAAFQLIDALLLRPLPVNHPEQLYVVTRQSIGSDGAPEIGESSSYPLFRMSRASAPQQAELLAISYAERADLAYGSSQETEKPYRQYVSGRMFESFGLRPALGRLFTEADDRTPGGHPYAVISYDYWTRRFGQDPRAVGSTFRMGLTLYEIVGVVRKGFTGTEPGVMVDVFVPTMMNAQWIDRPYTWWLRTFVRVPPGVSVQVVRDRLQAALRAFEEERVKTMKGVPEDRRRLILNERVVLEPASSGVSGMQKKYRLGLTVLGVLVGLVLLIACANVANLMTARAAARAREMALRVSIGAGRGRLVQLIVVESAWIALLASALGNAFAWWAARFVVVRINPRDNPARLELFADWRMVAFGLGMAVAVTMLFGLSPALRASAVKPARALRGDEDPHARRRLMQVLIAVQVAFCFVVLFVGSLLVATSERLARQPTGFSSERLLTLDVMTSPAQPPFAWEQVAARLRTVPGVEAAALAGWPLLSNQGWNGFVSVGGASPSQVLCDFLSASPRWLETMKISLLDGRDFQPNDKHPGVAIVNQAFAMTYLGGENPLGRVFTGVAGRTPIRIVGVVANARYWSMRDAMGPAAYLPFAAVDEKGAPDARASATLLVRTSTVDPAGVAAVLRREITRARAGFRVSNIHTQEELIQMSTVRERLLSLLALFFSAVALLLASLGLFGVLDYSVLQRRREIGIRMALGAPAASVVRRVIGESFAMVLVGAIVGLGLGLAAERYIKTLLYEVNPTEFAILTLPSLALLAATLLAALPPVLRAVRLDPIKTLRAE
jgi:putative ABC transport system permease protein